MRRALRLLARTVVLTPFICTVLLLAASPFFGRFLVVEAPLAEADAIVVLAGSTAARWMEAIDLFHAGVAPHILLSRGNIEPAVRGLNARGVYLPNAPESARDAMIKLTIPASAVEVWPQYVDNTAHEAEVTRAIAENRGWKRLLIVTSKYHTRRTRFAFERAFRGSGIEVSVRGTRYEPVSPERWWLERYDTRWVATELPKLVAYVFGLAG